MSPPSRRAFLQRVAVGAVSATVASHLDLLEFSLGTSTPQPSELVKASPYLMGRLTEGTMTLGEAEWCALGAELHKERFSKSSFYRERGEKWGPDYWVTFFLDEQSESLEPLYWEQLSKTFPTVWVEKKAQCLAYFQEWKERDERVLAQIKAEPPTSLREQKAAAYEKEISIIERTMQRISY